MIQEAVKTVKNPPGVGLYAFFDDPKPLVVNTLQDLDVTIHVNDIGHVLVHLGFTNDMVEELVEENPNVRMFRPKA
jgi:hypothetical protein